MSSESNIIIRLILIIKEDWLADVQDEDDLGGEADDEGVEEDRQVYLEEDREDNQEEDMRKTLSISLWREDRRILLQLLVWTFIFL